MTLPGLPYLDKQETPPLILDFADEFRHVNRFFKDSKEMQRKVSFSGHLNWFLQLLPSVIFHCL